MSIRPNDARHILETQALNVETRPKRLEANKKIKYEWNAFAIWKTLNSVVSFVQFYTFSFLIYAFLFYI